MKIQSIFGAGGLVMAAGIAVAMPMLGAAACEVAANGDKPSAAEARLEALMDQAIDQGGPFFTPEERAVIERACGYAPGTWDGFQVNMIGRVFYCTNGRRVSSPEVRAVMAAAEPRIDAHMDRVLERPDIVEAMDQVAREAEADATCSR
ncbi:MAG: hypothetical protein M3177_06095 [Pseudomonadota bacterium]|nr:hypothetical protein [Pseudomonadota bacterium]